MNAESCIVFWKYDSNRTLEELDEFQNYEDAKRVFEVEAEIPLEKIGAYLWDEQIFVMPYNIYVNEYRQYLRTLGTIYLETNKSSVFFSIIVSGNITISGLNRTMPPIALIKPYDDSDYLRLRIISTPIKTSIYFQLTQEISKVISIWDTSSNIDSLFKSDLLQYFNIQGKVIHGRFDIQKLFHDGILQKIE
jgi:hypothetical protein